MDTPIKSHDDSSESAEDRSLVEIGYQWEELILVSLENVARLVRATGKLRWLGSLLLVTNKEVQRSFG